MKKSGKDFWKSWNSKFKSKKRLPQVGGLVDNKVIASNFANHFEKHCQPSSLELNDTLKLNYEKLRANYHGNPILENQSFDV